MQTSAAVVLLISVLGACAPSDVSLSVDVITDWQPFLDFTTVHTELWSTPPGDSAPGGVVLADYEVDGDEAFIAGHRVAELTGLVAGPRWVRVTLRDPEERAVARRTVALDLTSSFAATVLLARACAGIECTAPQECQGGSCVDPECSPTSTEFCPEGCTTDAECAAELTDCEGEPVCVSMACLCDTTPDVGGETNCVNGSDDDGDGETDCEDSDCIGASCDDGVACTHTDRCAGGECTGTGITCADEECLTRSCNGTSSCTESNDDGASCSDDGEPCTADVCVSGVCQHNAVPSHTVCPGQSDRRRLCCGGSCVNTRLDPMNCGACGFRCLHECNYDADIDASACTCPGGPSDCIFGSGPNCFAVCFCDDDGDCPGAGRCIDLDAPDMGMREHCVY